MFAQLFEEVKSAAVARSNFSGRFPAPRCHLPHYPSMPQSAPVEEGFSFQSSCAPLGPAVWRGALGKSHSLHTRGIVELAGAISCGTGRSPLAYIGYGCYCGLGGQGWPKDKTDWCCHRHDCCYDKAEKEGCSPKSQRYQWVCEQNTVKCDNLTDRCEKMVCLCDQEAAKCWGAAPYNPYLILWPDFLCGQTHPTCHFRYRGPE
ncbi:phospholipase A2-like [Apus apus]|uniref:phospholipase A2-like n=1 Tax=Apus apus TaxID=8895 RepID=UPI0021F83A56|nr:phospholipase A2-like [Apus apus]